MSKKMSQVALDAAVVRFQKRVAADPELAGHFDGMDMRRILTRQMALLAFSFQPPVQSLRAAK